MTLDVEYINYNNDPTTVMCICHGQFYTVLLL